MKVYCVRSGCDDPRGPNEMVILDLKRIRWDSRVVRVTTTGRNNV